MGGVGPSLRAAKQGWRVCANAAWRLEALLGHLTQHRFGLFTSCPPLAYSLLTLLPLCTLVYVGSPQWKDSCGGGGNRACVSRLDWWSYFVLVSRACIVHTGLDDSVCALTLRASGAWLLRRVKLEALAATARPRRHRPCNA